MIDPAVVDLAALARWMDGEGLGQGAITGATRLAGGTQNVLLRLTRSGRDYVLRRPPPVLRPNSNAAMLREARLLHALVGSDVPHPRLIATCDDPDVLGGAVFYLMEPVEGFSAPAGLPPLHAADPVIRRRMGLALVEGVEHLHRVDYLAAGLDGFGNPEGYLARQVGRWQSQLDGYARFDRWPGPSGLPGLAEVADWLRAHLPPEAPAGIVHGDYQLANVLYRPDGPELAAIVDWELASIGDPLVDLGWIVATWHGSDKPDLPVLRVEPWEGFPTSDELIDHYAARSGRDLGHIDWYVVLACYRLGILLEGTFARACNGAAPMETGRLLHEAAVGLFQRATNRIRRPRQI
ncbi:MULTISPECIES: phosphotransferase family protein [unclassified Haematobacter]|uniref:phosphotransferase family protein n=1 Tax=unclassified Haematobacter TaxID=2640585 RepID=UPI0025C71594|nr:MULTISPECIES: phosphotransferase family protein [unclassified Haematobacter]